MRKILTLATLFLLAGSAIGQIYNPVKWSFASKQLNDKEFSLQFTATIEKGWYVYSQYLEGDDGPVKTSFVYEKGSHFAVVGKNVETSEHRKELNDPLFDNMKVIKFSDKVVFTQKVSVSDFSKPVSGYLEFMTCDNEKCLPPAEVDFSFQLKPATVAPDAKVKPEKPADPKAAVQTPAGKETAAAPLVAPVTAPPATAAGDAQSAIFDPVKWALSVQKINEQEYDLIFKATVDKGWYLYSQNIEPGGPEPTLFLFPSNPNLEMAGKAAETSAHKIEGHDPIFDMKVTKFKEEVTFTQKIKVKDASQPVAGILSYMTCNDVKCLPPTDVPFKVTPATLVALIGVAANQDAGVASAATGDFVLDTSAKADCGSMPEEEKKSLWSIFLWGILGGLIALLTPCVFPMIPLTVSFFTKSGGKEAGRSKGLWNAALYGFFILLVYVLCSAPFHLLDSVSPDILNDISTNTWLNVTFFVVFLAFAFSFFGYYELTLPSSWANKVSAAEGVGGTVGTFFMALTLVLVSFSCTGPILGTLLGTVLNSDAGATELTVGMAGFGVALGLPFGLFAAFPSWMQSLPKSGGWMTTVKVVLGFIELALALKFLSNADLVKHWGILKIEVFLGLWILIALGLGIYLLGKIRFPHDSPVKKLHPVRIVLAMASFAFAAYMVTGFFTDQTTGNYKPLKLLSGLAPPSCYSILRPCDCPGNLNCFKDFYEGLAFAKKMNKPIMIDFTGYACVNCRKMEEHVWPDPKIFSHLNNDFVLISLYVDDKKELPTEEQKTVAMKSGGTRKLRTKGHKWAYFQTENFDNNSQPYYVLLSADGKLLNSPVGYTPDEKEYANFLQCGLDNFKKIQPAQNLLGEK